MRLGFAGLAASPITLKEMMIPNISPEDFVDAAVGVFGGYDTSLFAVSIKYPMTSFFQRPPGIGAKLEKGAPPLFNPRIQCLASLGQIQSSLRSLNVTLASIATMECFCSCSFVALLTTTHSARRTLWKPRTSQSVTINHHRALPNQSTPIPHQ